MSTQNDDEDDLILAAVCRFQLGELAAVPSVVVLGVRTPTNKKAPQDPPASLLALVRAFCPHAVPYTQRPRKPEGLMMDNGPIKRVDGETIVEGAASLPGTATREYAYTVEKKATGWQVTSSRVTIMV